MIGSRAITLSLGAAGVICALMLLVALRRPPKGAAARLAGLMAGRAYRLRRPGARARTT